tara:strand:+ start:1338 stop:2528 length:1191 start_codon:yes stop_codon:yes gene_type:complete
MLDKKKILNIVTGDKNFNIKISKPFYPLSIEFLNDFSNALKNFKKIKTYPDLIYLMFWCRGNRIKDLSKDFADNKLRLGRGLIFHICPSNVPTNFVYSFFFGLLSGNSNIVKVPSKKFKEKEIILKILNSLLKKNKYLLLKKSNTFIEYNSNAETTKLVSSICDGRVIWGGDKTINEIRKFWIPERAVELTFSDRYSISIINLDQLKKINVNTLQQLAKKFYLDGYSMNQAACNSPHFVFWVGKNNENLKNKFWKLLIKIVKQKFSFDDIHVVDKYTNLIENIITQKDFDKIKMFKNNLYIINANKINQLENIRGVNGTFFQKNIPNINNLKKFITKKCQTVSYFGFDKELLKKFLLNNNLSGIDRMVPIGNALDINIVWDGYEVTKNLSRVISVE